MNESFSNGPGHMTKMAAMTIYDKNLKKSSSQADGLEFGMQHCVLECYQIVQMMTLGCS